MIRRRVEALKTQAGLLRGRHQDGLRQEDFSGAIIRAAIHAG